MSTNMQRFTERARRALNTAQVEAERLGQHVICPEHLLLGLMLDDGGIAYEVLNDLGIDTESMKKVVSRLAVARNEDIGENQQSLSPATESTLEKAFKEARRLGHRYIGTEHLLLSLVRDEDGIANQVLKKLGISSQQVRRHTRRVLKENTTTQKEKILGQGQRKRKRTEKN